MEKEEKTMPETLDSFDFDVDNGITGMSVTGQDSVSLERDFLEGGKTETEKPEEKKTESNEPAAMENKKEDGFEVDMELPETEETASQQEPEIDDYYNRLLDNFVEQGFISSDLKAEDGHILTNDEFVDIMRKQKMQDAMDIFQKEFVSKFQEDPEALAFLNYKLQGGNTRDFLDVYSKSADYGNIDTSTSAGQDFILRDYYLRKGFSEQQVADQIQMLTDSGKKEEYAKNASAELDRIVKQEQQDLSKRLEQEKQEEAKRADEVRRYYQNAVGSVDDVNGVKLNNDTKNRLYALLCGNIRLEDGSVMPAMTYKIQQVLSDPKKCVVFAHMLDNDFDFGVYARAIETQKTKEISRNLIKNKSGKASTGSGGRGWF
ncbi:MAG: hypothetical protein II063_10390 [Prevotella sp.]|nr:hypothetical protein [Prevotella sp.]